MSMDGKGAGGVITLFMFFCYTFGTRTLVNNMEVSFHEGRRYSRICMYVFEGFSLAGKTRFQVYYLGRLGSSSDTYDYDVMIGYIPILVLILNVNATIDRGLSTTAT